MPFKALYNQTHQFGASRQVPVSIGHVNMPKIGRQDWQTTLYVLARTVPLHQCLYREPVAKVVEAWSMACGNTTQTDSS